MSRPLYRWRTWRERTATLQSTDGDGLQPHKVCLCSKGLLSGPGADANTSWEGCQTCGRSGRSHAQALMRVCRSTRVTSSCSHTSTREAAGTFWLVDNEWAGDISSRMRAEPEAHKGHGSRPGPAQQASGPAFPGPFDARPGTHLTGRASAFSSRVPEVRDQGHASTESYPQHRAKVARSRSVWPAHREGIKRVVSGFCLDVHTSALDSGYRNVLSYSMCC